MHYYSIHSCKQLYLCYISLAYLVFGCLTLGCDDTRSCKNNEECAQGYYCDPEGYCTQLTAYVTCGEERCFAPEVCVNGQVCMVLEDPAGTEAGDVPLAGVQVDSQLSDMILDLTIIQDMSQRDSFTYTDLEFRDMRLPQDMSVDPLDRDQGGQACQNTCDCSPGLACVAGVCEASSSPVYCCESTFCPPNEVCQTSEGSQGICPDVSCATACDCDPGLSCIDNVCALGNSPLFCCEANTCPSGQTCENRRGVRGMCPSAPCTSACDCSNGQRCVNGTCVLQGDPVFCCDQGACPAGSSCQTSTGELALCQDNSTCQSACDCMSGMACLAGSCVLGDQPIFCCEDSFCPSGERCESRQGGPFMLCAD